MKILFLDIDGVLNRHDTEERCGRYLGVDRRLSDKFLAWLRTTDVDVVLSSTWRKHLDMFNHLNEAGIHWIGSTPHIPSAERGLEIRTWLHEHPEVTEFAILDDMADMLPEQLPNFVQTDTDIGIEDKHIEKLNAIFNKKKKNDDTFRPLPGKSESTGD